MKTTFISTNTLWNSPRSNLDRMQTDLVKANKELTLGRSADVGLKLGYQTGETISLRQDMGELDALIDSNANVKIRLDATTAALESVREMTGRLRSSLISAPLTDENVAVIQNEARTNFGGLLADLNKQVNGQYIFGGIKTQEKPMADFATVEAAIDGAFAAKFGFAQNDPAVSGITPAEMEDFLTGAFADLFTDAGWASWSKASSRNILSSVSTSDRIETSINANAAAFRDLAASYAMVFGIGLNGLNDNTKTYLIDQTIRKMSSGADGSAELQAQIGSAKNTLMMSNDRMELQKYIFEERLAKFEGVDAAEAKIRVDQLSTQIQVSYRLTAQLRQLSLVNFI
jgi:flagellar hook-associated protein 3 FlgL